MLFEPSFTVLKKWASKDTKGAIDTYFYLEEPISNSAIAQGKIWHEEFMEHVAMFGELPHCFHQYCFELNHAQVEQEVFYQVSDSIRYHGFVDLYDINRIIDYKIGATKAHEYVSSMQIPTYAACLRQSGRRVSTGHILAYNPSNQEASHALLFLSNPTLDAAEDWIVSNSVAMYNHCQSENLFNQFNERRSHAKVQRRQILQDDDIDG